MPKSNPAPCKALSAPVRKLPAKSSWNPPNARVNASTWFTSSVSLFAAPSGKVFAGFSGPSRRNILLVVVLR
jgi:hypothetical protein